MDMLFQRTSNPNDALTNICLEGERGRFVGIVANKEIYSACPAIQYSRGNSGIKKNQLVKTLRRWYNLQRGVVKFYYLPIVFHSRSNHVWSYIHGSLDSSLYLFRHFL